MSFGDDGDSGMLPFMMQMMKDKEDSVKGKELEIGAAKEQREEVRDDTARRKEELAGLRSSAGASGRNNAERFIAGRGLDPSEHGATIDDFINSTMSGIAPDDPNPGSYFQNAGETLWERESGNTRNRATRELDRLLPANFETTRIANDLDDPYLAAIEAEGRTSADQVIQNMLKRGVITPTGYNAAGKELDRQAPGVRGRLNEVGTTTLAGGQQKLRDAANRGRQQTSSLEFGSTFDPMTYSSDVDRQFNEFIGSLGDTLRSKAPKNLFDTSGLGVIAGSAQGAGNTKFDPRAAAGIIEDDKPDDEATNPNSIF